MPTGRSEPGGALVRVSGVHVAARDVMTPDGPTVEADYDARPDFVAFYDEAYRRVVAALSSTLGDRELGAEAADEAMARCYAQWTKVGHYDNPSGWVYRVGLNWALSVRRRLARRYRLVPPPEATEPEMPADPRVAEALASLDLKLRSVVVCRVLLDWSTDDTADALEIKPGTVKSRLHRGLNRLQDMLADRGIHDGHP
jgi:RNA polymerase sigma factor (sigma-70 family)